MRLIWGGMILLTLAGLGVNDKLLVLRVMKFDTSLGQLSHGHIQMLCNI